MKQDRKTDLYAMIQMITQAMNAVILLTDKLLMAKTFAKMQVYHPTILTNDDLFSELQLIKQQLTNVKLPLPLKEENLYAIEKALKIKAYRKGTIFRFLIDLPLCEPDTYQYYRLYPLPTFQNETFWYLNVQNPYLAENQNRYIPMERECLEIKEETFLCNKHSTEITSKSPCEYQLLKHLYTGTGCSSSAKTKNPAVITRVTDNEWLFYTPTQERVTIRCHKKSEDRILNGNLLIQITDGCDLKWKHEIIKSYISKLPDRKFQMTNVEVRNIPEEIPHWKREDLELQRVQWNNFNKTTQDLEATRQELQEIQGTYVKKFLGSTIATPCIVTVVILGIIAYMKYRGKTTPKMETIDVTLPQAEDRHPWTQSSILGGRSYSMQVHQKTDDTRKDKN
ncbi:uncharacterized protein [Onthophagus taurus]|uniref:uncharacterized protein n=1 Tax=Onthophagus taurus TaxID=166361 RepID=UPI0039BE2219